MNISDHVAQFIEVVSRHFPPRRMSDEDTEAWASSLNRIIRRVDAETLAVAAEIILETRDPSKDGRMFPAPKECLAACEKARERIRLKRAPPLLSHGRADTSQFATWRIELADELIRGSMGQRAAQEGWGLALRDFCRREGRLPNEGEARECRQSARAFDEALAACRAGDAGILSTPLARLGESMLEARDGLADTINSKGAA